MTIVAGTAGVLLIFFILLDGFEAIVLPRRVRRPFRLTRLFYRVTWIPWRWVVGRIRKRDRREGWLSYFGPLSLLILLAVWAAGLIVGFGAIYWAFGSPMAVAHGTATFGIDLYLSGTTFFTLGLGDVAPLSPAARLVVVVESGTGLGFLALVLSYLPALNTAYANREVNVSILDEQAGSPPNAVEFLRRHCDRDAGADVVQFLRDWEGWAAQLMESHLSYPVLAYYRSQHENQSWVTALTMILDLCTLILTGLEGLPKGPAQRTFAMARHAGADLSQVFGTPPQPPRPDRLPAAGIEDLRQELALAGIKLADGPEAQARIIELRSMYEPFMNALAQYLVMDLPPWMDQNGHDNWQVTAWDLDKVE